MITLSAAIPQYSTRCMSSGKRIVNLLKKEVLTFRNTWVYPPVFSGALVAQSLVFAYYSLPFRFLSFDHCIACPSIYVL
jgi:hypothetical protein